MECNRDGALCLASFREGIVISVRYIARKHTNHAIWIVMFIIGLNITNIYSPLIPHLIILKMRRRHTNVLARQTNIDYS
jgi:hypothetical protein